ncbi:MAG: hypothetical protein ACRC8A_19525 [Microcoleaceae cyanobacterium]
MTITLKLTPILHLTDDQFYRLCGANRDLRLELTATGELIVNPPTGSETGQYLGIERQQQEKLAAKLRELNIDPDTL